MSRVGSGMAGERLRMQQSAVRRLRTDDSGMTVVEVVVASFILFFVLTAVLGLVGATTQTSVSAKQRTAMTNAVSSYIEHVRSLPFNRVALSTDNPPGDVQPSVVKAEGAFTITLTNSVAVGAHNTRELSVSAVCTAPGYPSMHTTAFTAIRDKLQGANDLGQPHSGGPIIEFGPDTPPENSTVYASSVVDGSFLYVDASAQSTSGVIYTMEFRVGDQRLRDNNSSDAGDAYWTPGVASAFQTIRWDTRQVRGATPTPAVMDGWRIVRILATDDLGRQTFKDRRFLVDNNPPSNPGTPVCVPRTNVTTLITWTRSMDGSDPAYRYDFQAYKDPAILGADWIGPETHSLDQPAHTLTTTAFSRYWLWVRALSPRGLASSYLSCGQPFVSRPLLTGEATCTITGANSTRASALTVALTFSQPSFVVSAIRYDLYRGTSPTALTLYRSAIGVGAPTFSDAVSQSLGPNGVPTAYYYQIKATFTPAGWPNGTSNPSQTVVSDIVGPTPTAPGSMRLVESW